ncbi:MAG: ACP S-malonyltransferase [Oscillospiraceae bacterium]|nr:ACP S-malonyltransferase [Oscillospiraceae bacterium]
MGKIAFVFAGQGSQTPGMGLSFYRSSEAARRVFNAADAARPGTSKQCFEGTEEELRETKNTQACLFTVEMATAVALAENGIKADMAAGFSLGEISALSYTRAMNVETGLRLVMRRGELMQSAAEKHATSMAAVIKLSGEQVREVCSKFEHIYPVNYNCPGQISVSGASDEMPLFSAAVKEAGGRAIPLKVNGAFHSPYMSEAAADFAKEIRAVDFSTPEMPIYSNYTGNEYAQDIKSDLEKQIDHPVQWETIIRRMIIDGVDTFFEIGPGKTLCGFIKKIDPSVRAFSIETAEDLEAACMEVKPCLTGRRQSLPVGPAA